MSTDDISIKEFLKHAFDNETIEKYAQRIKESE
jgi:hypothetical protein